jgi:asparagine synthase (glutamine-hydrolysing)
VTVALSGDGGDELFFGYERPLSLLRDGTTFRWPWVARRGLYLAGRMKLSRPRSSAISAHSPGDYYFNVNTRLDAAQLTLLAPDLRPQTPADFALYAFGGYRGQRHLAGWSRWVEYYGQLQRGLKKVDMASMHTSLEVRVPILDREVIEQSLRIAPAVHMAGARRKAVLRDVLGRLVPPRLIDSQKLGFAVPLGEWFRGALRDAVRDRLLGGDLWPAGVFSRRGVQALVDDQLTGRKDRKWALWTLLCLQLWADRHLPRKAAT